MSNLPRTVCRIQKIKTEQELAQRGSHNFRLRPVINADPKRRKYNRVFIGSNDLKADWQNYIDKKGIKKIRKNAVIAVEMILSFSPCFLKKEDGSYFQDAKHRLQNWVKLNLSWLNKRYGDRVINCVSHGDEETYHLHCILVLTDQKPDGSWKLNARKFFGGRNTLSELQTSYAEVMKPLGLVRGVKGSRAKHQSIKSYYTALNKVEALCEKLAIKKPASRDPKDFGHWTVAMSKIADALSSEHSKKIKSLETQLAQEKALTQQLIQMQHTELKRELKPRLGKPCYR
ncbi:plasmid recombination protein [Thalassotalea sp. LPB0316]|uniref:MobV family relaxase n=1 Tax=Thalassotalea sp. LPB0316 TaxID=2769490 RepID=UPI0018668876|nr:MobV family relaxase [Thalassotalea sp. LPB0316]QOL26232.1 plasmid recombination protein [Thalassotalea sp. LPB0316]